MKTETFVVIEQAEDNSAYVTRVTGKTPKEALDKYSEVGIGAMVLLTEEDFGNMCIAGST